MRMCERTDMDEPKYPAVPMLALSPIFINDRIEILEPLHTLSPTEIALPILCVLRTDNVEPAFKCPMTDKDFVGSCAHLTPPMMDKASPALICFLMLKQEPIATAE
jgi:hypothetical protein